jgi:hypothetical protein
LKDRIRHASGRRQTSNSQLYTAALRCQMTSTWSSRPNMVAIDTWVLHCCRFLPKEYIVHCPLRRAVFTGYDSPSVSEHGKTLFSRSFPRQEYLLASGKVLPDSSSHLPGDGCRKSGSPAPWPALPSGFAQPHSDGAQSRLGSTNASSCTSIHVRACEQVGASSRSPGCPRAGERGRKIPAGNQGPRCGDKCSRR